MRVCLAWDVGRLLRKAHFSPATVREPHVPTQDGRSRIAACVRLHTMHDRPGVSEFSPRSKIGGVKIVEEVALFPRDRVDVAHLLLEDPVVLRLEPAVALVVALGAGACVARGVLAHLLEARRVPLLLQRLARRLPLGPPRVRDRGAEALVLGDVVGAVRPARHQLLGLVVQGKGEGRGEGRGEGGAKVVWFRLGLTWIP